MVVRRALVDKQRTGVERDKDVRKGVRRTEEVIRRMAFHGWALESGRMGCSMHRGMELVLKHRACSYSVEEIRQKP